MEEHALIEVLNKELDAAWPNTLSAAELREQLVAFIDQLINKDFQRLLAILYRIDVDEARLRLLLQQQADRPAAEIIADSIIDRQQQKIESRKKFRQPPAASSGDADAERW